MSNPEIYFTHSRPGSERTFAWWWNDASCPSPMGPFDSEKEARGDAVRCRGPIHTRCAGCVAKDVRHHTCAAHGCPCAPCFAERMLGNVRRQPDFARTCDRYADAIQHPERHGSKARVDDVRRWGLVETREAPTELGMRVAAVALALAAAKAREDCDQEPVVTEIDVSNPNFICVDVEYSSKGYRALYEYRTRDANFCLAQD